MIKVVVCLTIVEHTVRNAFNSLLTDTHSFSLSLAPTQPITLNS